MSRHRYPIDQPLHPTASPRVAGHYLPCYAARRRKMNRVLHSLFPSPWVKKDQSVGLGRSFVTNLFVLPSEKRELTSGFQFHYDGSLMFLFVVLAIVHDIIYTIDDFRRYC